MNAKLKQSPTYRYTKELVRLFDKGGKVNECIEIPMNIILKAPLPEYMPQAEATRCKVAFCMALYANFADLNWIVDAIHGMSTMIANVEEETRE